MAVLEMRVCGSAGNDCEVEESGLAVVSWGGSKERMCGFDDKSFDAVVVEADDVDRFGVVADLEIKFFRDVVGELRKVAGGFC